MAFWAADRALLRTSSRTSVVRLVHAWVFSGSAPRFPDGDTRYSRRAIECQRTGHCQAYANVRGAMGSKGLAPRIPPWLLAKALRTNAWPKTIAASCLMHQSRPGGPPPGPSNRTEATGGCRRFLDMVAPIDTGPVGWRYFLRLSAPRALQQGVRRIRPGEPRAPAIQRALIQRATVDLTTRHPNFLQTHSTRTHTCPFLPWTGNAPPVSGTAAFKFLPSDEGMYGYLSKSQYHPGSINLRMVVAIGLQAITQFLVPLWIPVLLCTIVLISIYCTREPHVQGDREHPSSRRG
ncbi:hypothetical protein BC834DRAFT_413524 [Gloeopeniophorella convolvens]|nr:hypothetical protein BC834DRAFT_413524 [Gloeopeniophorella convolvens]